MNISVPRSDLARGLTLAARIAPRKGTLPILSHVLMRANKHALTLHATDLNVSLAADLKCHVDKPGAIAVNAADLQRFVAGCSGDEASIKVDGSAWAEVRCGKARYRLAGMSDRDFPKVHATDGKGTEVEAAALLEMLNAASYAVSLDDSREAMCGVWIESVDGKCTVASTDSHRIVLAVRPLKLPDGARTVSARGAAEFARLLVDHDKCRVSFDAKRMTVSTDDTTMSAGLLDFVSGIPILRGKVAEIKARATAVVDRDQLLAAIKRVSPLSSETSGITVRSTQTGLSLSTRSDGSEMSDEVACEVKGEIGMCLNAKYLADAVSHMAGETLTLRVSGELDPIVIADNDDLAVVMPMRMN